MYGENATLVIVTLYLRHKIFVTRVIRTCSEALVASRNKCADRQKATTEASKHPQPFQASPACKCHLNKALAGQPRDIKVTKQEMERCKQAKGGSKLRSCAIQRIQTTEASGQTDEPVSASKAERVGMLNARASR